MSTDAPPLAILYVPLDEVLAAPRNPKGHDEPGIAASIRRHGFVEPALHDGRTGRILGGHGRAKALRTMQAAGEDPPANIVVADGGEWRMPVVMGHQSANDLEAEALLISLNGLTIAGGYESLEMLADMLVAVRDESAGGLDGTGYVSLDIDRMMDEFAAADDPDDLGALGDADEDRAKLLTLLDVSIGDPKHEVAHGELWRMGPHRLAVLDLMRDWPTWTPLLRAGDLFVPYPGPFIALSRRFKLNHALLLQPSVFLAGHVLDKYASVHGDGEVELLEELAVEAVEVVTDGVR